MTAMTTTPLSRNGLMASRHWRQIRRYVHVEVYDRDGGHAHPRVRFEVHASNTMLFILTAIKVPCVACGRPIHPVRARAENDDLRNPASRPPPAGHHYLAVTCPLSTKIGCSRSGAARDEYNQIKLALRPDLATRTESQPPSTTKRPTTTRRPLPMKKTTKTAAKSPKKLTARDKALAKIKSAKLALKTARASAASATRVASEKRKLAKKATTEQERAEGMVYQRGNQLARAQDALTTFDEKLAAAKAAKLAKAEAKAAKHVHAAPTEGVKASSEPADDEDEKEETEPEVGATEEDDMGDDDDADEKPTAADDMGAEEEDETDEDIDTRADSV